MSIATKQSKNDIHGLCCCHIKWWWSLFSEYCIRTWIVFYTITSEYQSTVVFLMLCFQFIIFQMTDVHQWNNKNFCKLPISFINHLFFTLDFLSKVDKTCVYSESWWIHKNAYGKIDTASSWRPFCRKRWKFITAKKIWFTNLVLCLKLWKFLQ